jgi:hypothetical protein
MKPPKAAETTTKETLTARSISKKQKLALFILKRQTYRSWHVILSLSLKERTFRGSLLHDEMDDVSKVKIHCVILASAYFAYSSPRSRNPFLKNKSQLHKRRHF